MPGNIYAQLRAELLPGKKVASEACSQLMRAGLSTTDRMIELLGQLDDAHNELDNFLHEQERRTRLTERAYGK